MFLVTRSTEYYCIILPAMSDILNILMNYNVPTNSNSINAAINLISSSFVLQHSHGPKVTALFHFFTYVTATG